MERLLYPIPEVAARLGIGRTVLYEKIAAGEIESVVIGRRRLVADSALRAYVDRLQTEPASRQPPPQRSREVAGRREAGTDTTTPGTEVGA